MSNDNKPGNIYLLSSKLKEIEPVTKDAHVDCDKVLEGAKGHCNEVLIIGQMNLQDDDGQPLSKQYIAGSTADKLKLLFMLERFKMDLLNGLYDGD